MNDNTRIATVFVGGLALGYLISKLTKDNSKDENTKQDSFSEGPYEHVFSEEETEKRQKSFLDVDISLLRKGNHESPSKSGTMSPCYDSVFRVVLTGGPCAGKSTIISTLHSYLTSKGFNVLHVQETATTLKNSGLVWSPELGAEFQNACISVQHNRENVAYRWGKSIAKSCLRKKTVIIYDRALVDGLCFVTEEMFNACLQNVGIEGDLYRRYDAVFHLVTAADGAVDFYKNTTYRFESVEQAIEQDRKLQQVWSNHPNHHIFGNDSSFQVKIEKVVGQLSEQLGLNTLQHKPIRYLLKSEPVIPVLLPVIRETYFKTYINYPSNEEGFHFAFLRYSKRLHGSTKVGATTYVLKQVFNHHGQEVTRKRNLTRLEYFELLRRQDPSRKVVEQKRAYVSLKDGSLLEAVQYEKPIKLHLLNIYCVVDTQFDKSIIPSCFDMKEEVTGNEEYSAHYISACNKNHSTNNK